MRQKLYDYGVNLVGPFLTLIPQQCNLPDNQFNILIYSTYLKSLRVLMGTEDIFSPITLALPHVPFVLTET